jgi:hypothetical protein
MMVSAVMAAVMAVIGLRRRGEPTAQRQRHKCCHQNEKPFHRLLPDQSAAKKRSIARCRPLDTSAEDMPFACNAGASR